MVDTELLYDPLFTTFLFGIISAILIYWFSVRNHDYWRKRHIPYVKPTPFFGSILEDLNKPGHKLEMERYFDLGPVYGFFEMNRPLLTIGDPGLLRKILLKDFPVFSTRREFSTNDEVFDNMLTSVHGDRWKRLRSIMTPTFSSGKIKRMLGIFKDCSKTLVGNFKTTTKQGRPINAKQLYGAFSMDVIASSAFSTKIDSHNDPENAFVKSARAVFQKRGNWRFLLHLFFPSLSKFLGISFRAPEINFFKEVTVQIVKERKRTGQVRNDFLQLLIDTSKEIDQEENAKSTSNKEVADVASNYIEEEVPSQPSPTPLKSALSMNELVAQCVIFFLAGYETTASTLSSATYCLALNPDVQEKLHKEVVKVLKENNGELTYENIQDMKYLDNVISETLRLYPPAVKIERMAEADYKVDELGITIPKGMIVGVPIFAIHRDPKHYPDPETFNPDRFLPEERAKRDSYVFIPFGSGPRNYIAMRFALLEMKVCLAHVVSAFKIKRCPQTKVPLEWTVSKSLLSAKDITVGLELREDV